MFLPKKPTLIYYIFSVLVVSTSVQKTYGLDMAMEALQKMDGHFMKLKNLLEEVTEDGDSIFCTTEENADEMSVFLNYITHSLKGSNKQWLISLIISKSKQFQSNWKQMKKLEQFQRKNSIQSSLDIIEELHEHLYKLLGDAKTVDKLHKSDENMIKSSSEHHQSDSRGLECHQQEKQCNLIICSYGVTRIQDSRGCTSCICHQPCDYVKCPYGTSCYIQFSHSKVNDGYIQAIPVCRTEMKDINPYTYDNQISNMPFLNDIKCLSSLQCCSSATGYLYIEPTLELKYKNKHFQVHRENMRRNNYDTSLPLPSASLVANHKMNKSTYITGQSLRAEPQYKNKYPYINRPNKITTTTPTSTTTYSTTPSTSTTTHSITTPSTSTTTHSITTPTSTSTSTESTPSSFIATGIDQQTNSSNMYNIDRTIANTTTQQSSLNKIPGVTSDLSTEHKIADLRKEKELNWFRQEKINRGMTKNNVTTTSVYPIFNADVKTTQLPKVYANNVNKTLHKTTNYNYIALPLVQSNQFNADNNNTFVFNTNKSNKSSALDETGNDPIEQSAQTHSHTRTKNTSTMTKAYDSDDTSFNTSHDYINNSKITSGISTLNTLTTMSYEKESTPLDTINTNVSKIESSIQPILKQTRPENMTSNGTISMPIVTATSEIRTQTSRNTQFSNSHTLTPKVIELQVPKSTELLTSTTTNMPTLSTTTTPLQAKSSENAISSSCVDNKFFSHCQLIAATNTCRIPYYAKFCCRTCTLKGFIVPM